MRLLKSGVCLCLILGLLLTLVGCTGGGDNKPLEKVYFTYFDTISYIYCYANEEPAVFEARAAMVSQLLWEYHQLFDIYHAYEGVDNLYTLNQQAGGDAMKADERLLDFLSEAKQLYTLTDGHMNVMMGSVLKLWHQHRTRALEDPDNATIPGVDALEEAKKHTDIESLEIDFERNTLRISDPKASIDVGAVGKGYAAEMAARALTQAGATGYVLNIGGNIRVIGTKPDGTGWRTGIKDPANPDEAFAAVLNIANTSCVTSGSYERFFTVNGVRYHHIIDEKTCMPAAFFPSVTVVTENSCLADALSTALFCMSQEAGAALVASMDGVEVLWVMADGEIKMSDGMAALVA